MFLVALMVGVLAALWVVLASAQSGATAARPGSLGTNGAEAPRIDWAACPSEVAPAPYECARVEVPLSYQNPDGRKIELALGRLPAENPEQKIGTLFWNPGGPGGGGRFPIPFSLETRERFDIVGFDPRGTHASTPLKCFTSNRQAADKFGRLFPITARQKVEFFDDNERGTDLCERNAGPIISHMSTANVARDMDLLRQAVGDGRTTYLGYSYGTHLGTVYANLFPKKVRALVLDSAIDPVEWTTGERPGDGRTQPVTYRVGHFDGSQDALESFLQECAAANDACAFNEPGAGAEDLLNKYEELLQRLRQGPAEVSDGGQTREVTYQDAVVITTSLLYDAQQSPTLAQFLQDLYEATNPAQRRAAAPPPEVDVPEVPDRPRLQPAEETYLGYEWFHGVTCADADNPSSQSAWSRYARQADERTPGFGSLWTYFSTPCATWPAEDPDRYAGPWNKETANPLLVIGNRQGDPATPYDDARTTAERRLADARLLTLNSFGHTAAYGEPFPFDASSRCIDEAVDRYLIEGALPPKGKVCQPDRQPFGGAGSDAAGQSAASGPAPPGS